MSKVGFIGVGTMGFPMAANILSKGNLEHPMNLFKSFRGREPKVEPLLKRDGLLKSS